MMNAKLVLLTYNEVVDALVIVEAIRAEVKVTIGALLTKGNQITGEVALLAAINLLIEDVVVAAEEDTHPKVRREKTMVYYWINPSSTK